VRPTVERARDVRVHRVGDICPPRARPQRSRHPGEDP